MFSKVFRYFNISWQIGMAYFIGMMAVVNIIIANLLSVEQIKALRWSNIFLLAHSFSLIVSLNTVKRERITRRKVAWCFVALSSILHIIYFVIRRIFSYQTDVFFIGVFVCTILGLALYFPKNAWSVGNVWRVIFDVILLAFSTIVLMQGFIYHFFGRTDESALAVNYVIWVGFEIAALIQTIFLWQRYRQRILALLALTAICVLIADVTGTIRIWYPEIRPLLGTPETSAYYLQLMITMIFAYYSVENLKEIDFNKRYDLSRIEWTVYAFTPQLFFCTGIVVAFLVYRPETWLIIAMALAAVCQAFIAITEEGSLIKRLFRAVDKADRANTQLAIVNSELTASNERLVRAQGQLHLLFEQIEELTLDQERTRIARAMHDGMGQHLLGAKLLAGALLAENRNDPDRVDLLGAIQAAQNEMQRTISALDQPLQHQSLEERLADVLHFARLSGLRTNFKIAGQARPVSATVRHTLGRIAQEALTNSGKYANAQQVLVTLDYTSPEAVALTITDDGQGFAAQVQHSDQGHGLRNMRERAEALGGQCTITSTAQGVTVWTSIPTSAS